MKKIIAVIFFSITTISVTGQTCLSGDCMNGYGKCYYTEPQEFTYEGNFVDGKWEGNGKLVIDDIYTYIGTFTNSSITGNGTMLYPNGDKYVGEVINGVLEGAGVYNFSTGKLLSGVFTNGNIWSGSGYFPLSNGEYYEGEFAEGNFNGQGTFHFENGETYTGNFENGEFKGIGTYYTILGESYTGTYSEGLLNGYGSYVDMDGLKYDGNFSGSKFNGYGERSYPDGTYKGNWVNGKRHGAGKLYNLSGELSFDGNWEDDKPQLPLSETQSEADRFDKIEELFSRCYKGYQEIIFFGQKGTIELEICFIISDDYTFYANSISTISIDEIDYNYKSVLKGTYDKDTNKISFREVDFYSADELPNGLYWIYGESGTGTVYRDKNHDGCFLIKGKTGNGDYFELSTNYN